MAEKITIVTFKGCQPTLDLRVELEALIEEQSLDIEIELDVVPSPSSALARRLFGSPTVFVGGRELRMRSAPPSGFY